MSGLRRAGFGWTLLAAVIVICYLFPVYWMAATSLKSNAAVYASPPQMVPSPVDFSSYVEAVI